MNVILTSYGESLISNLVSIQGFVLLADEYNNTSSSTLPDSSLFLLDDNDSCGNIYENSIGKLKIQDTSSNTYTAKSILFYDSTRKIVGFYSQETPFITKTASILSLYISFNFSICTNGFSFSSVQVGHRIATNNVDGHIHIEDTTTNADDNYSVYSKTQTDTAISTAITNIGLATVATSGNYNDLTNTPTIPSATAGRSDNGYLYNGQNVDTIIDNVGISSTNNLINTSGVTSYVSLRANNTNPLVGFKQGENLWYVQASANYFYFGPTSAKALRLDQEGNGVFQAGSLTATSIIKSGGTSSQFLKADGSVDSNTYLTSSIFPISSTNINFEDTIGVDGGVRPLSDGSYSLGESDYHWDSIYVDNIFTQYIEGTLEGNATGLSNSSNTLLLNNNCWESNTAIKTQGLIGPYITCDTLATVTKKEVIIPNFKFYAGARLLIKFTHSNSVSNPTLCIHNESGDTGTDIAIKLYGTTSVGSNYGSIWLSGQILELVYDGTYWYWEGFQHYSNAAISLANTRSIEGVGFNGTSNVIHYGTCSTSASTQIKDVTIANFNYSSIPTGARVIVKFTNSNSASNPKLRVNTSGTNGTAKSIMRSGTSSVGTSNWYTWQSGSVVEFIYDGTNWVWVGFQYFTSESHYAEISSNSFRILHCDSENYVLDTDYYYNEEDDENIEALWLYRDLLPEENTQTGLIPDMGKSDHPFSNVYADTFHGVLDGNSTGLSKTVSNTTYTVTLNASNQWETSQSIVANSFIKSGGTSSQFLKADGSVDTNTYVTTDTNQTITGDKTINEKDLLITDNQSTPVTDSLDSFVLKRGQEFIIGTQSASTYSWTGNTKQAAIYDGMCINYYLPYGSSNSYSATLELTLPDNTTTGAIPVRRQGNNTVYNDFPRGSIIQLTLLLNKYVGSTLFASVWLVNTYYYSDTNYYDRIYNYGFVKAGTNGIYGYTLVLRTGNDTWESIVTSRSTGTSKSANTSGFYLDTLYYIGTSIDTASGGTISYLYSIYPYCSVSYLFNLSTSLTANLPIYLIFTYNSSDGKFYLNTTKWWTQTPLSEDATSGGNTQYFLYLGRYCNSYLSLEDKHPLFYKKSSTELEEISVAVIKNTPTKTSQLTNDSGFITSSSVPTNYVTTNTAQNISADKTFTNSKGIIFNTTNGDSAKIYGTPVTGPRVSYNDLDLNMGTLEGHLNIYFPGNTQGTTNLTYVVGNDVIYPYQSGVDLGTSSYKWDSVYANNFYGYFDGNLSGNAATATSATKATQDGSGNTITSSYCNLSTDQTIQGKKTFSDGLEVSSGKYLSVKGNASGSGIYFGNTSTSYVTIRGNTTDGNNGYASLETRFYVLNSEAFKITTKYDNGATYSSNFLTTIPSKASNWTVGSSAYPLANVYADTFHGSLDGSATSAGTATSATSATNDASGNEIAENYIKTLGVSNYENTALSASDSYSTGIANLTRSNWPVFLYKQNGKGIIKYHYCLNMLIASAILGRSNSTLDPQGSPGCIAILQVQRDSNSTVIKRGVIISSTYTVTTRGISSSSYNSNIGWTSGEGSTVSGTWVTLNYTGTTGSSYNYCMILAIRIY